MSDQRIPISQLSETQTAPDASYIAIDDGSLTKKITVENFNSTSTASAQQYASQAAASAQTVEDNIATSAAQIREATLAAREATQASTAASASATSAYDSASLAQNYSVNAATSAGQAMNAADTVAQGVTESKEYAEDSEAWAVGKRNGSDVPSSDVAYHNNAKYYSDNATTAATSAASDADRAEAAADSINLPDSTLTVSGTAADSKAAGDGIRALFDAYETGTASGTVVTFDDGASGAPLKTLTANIVLTQSGTGDPSPDNIRPITGYTGVTFTRTDGENPPGVIDTFAVTFPTEAGTVCSGTLTVNENGTGLLEVDKIHWKPTAESVTGTMATGENGNRCGIALGYRALSTTDLICSCGVADSAVNRDTASGWIPGHCALFQGGSASAYLRYIFPTSITTSAAALQYLLDNQCEIVYTPSAPVVYSLSTDVVRTLLGSNEITMDANGSMAVTYFVDENKIHEELFDIRVTEDGETAATAGDAVREQIGELKDIVHDNIPHALAVPIGKDSTWKGLTIDTAYDVITINGTATDNVVFVFKSDGTIGHYTGMSPDFFAADFRNTLEAGHDYRITSRLIGGTIVKNGITYTPDNLWGGVNVARSYLMRAGATGSGQYIARAALGFADFSLDAYTSETGAFCIYLYNGVIYNNAEFSLSITRRDEVQKSAVSVHQITTNWPEINKVVARENIGTMSRAELEAYGVNSLEFVPGMISTPAVGSVLADFTPTSDDRDIVCAVAECSQGTRFKVKVYGAGAAAGGGVRAYSWLDSSKTVLAESAKDVTVDDIITAPTNAAYVVFNNFTDRVADFYVVNIGVSVDDGSLPDYWESAVNSGIDRANRIILEGGPQDTMLYITDTHWRANKKHSPAIAREIMNRCNINNFICGGDLVERHHTSSKYDAADELRDCINAFKDLPLPMITVYGNHDRNRNANSDHPETFLTYREHFNVVNMSFCPNPYIKYANDDLFYWDTLNYRYVCMYWYYSTSRSQPGLAEAFDTDKPVVVICHGIYFQLNADTTQDVLDNAWILGVLEPYKTQIRCIIQGHTHRDGLRYAWETVPIVILTCDKTKDGTDGTDEEQALSIVTINADTIYVTRIGYGNDFTVTADTPIWQTET